MKTKCTFQITLFLFFSIQLFNTIQAQVPNFTLTDIDGVEHNLYEDYLDQGKTVMLSFGGTWAIWDSVWLSSGVMQEFQDVYVSSGEAVILFIDPFGPSLEEFMGISGNTLGYDYVSSANFPLISSNGDIAEAYDVSFFPTIRIICPDRTGYSDGQSISGVFTENEDIRYTNLESAEVIADLMFENCGTSFEVSAIQGLVYHDLDDNCSYDQNESGSMGIKSLITGPNGTVTRITNTEGIFRKVVAPGDYNVSIVPPNELWSSCDVPVDINFGEEEASTEEVSFGLQALEDCPKLMSTITAPFLRRCFDANLFVSYCNEGTIVAEDVYVTVTLDEYMEYVSSNLTPSSIDGQTLTFDIGTLQPLDCGKIRIVFFTDCDVELETEQCYSTAIYPDYDCDQDPRFQTETECQEIRGAFDPNDKRAFPLSGSDEYVIEPNTIIKYQLRFQNTGTDTAFNIFIEDEISENLDIGSFRVGQASHDYEIEFDEARKMTIYFPNVMLPDSNVNLIGSNGFINYYIDQKPNLANGTTIENSAGIFFDFNEPVLTNTTTHIVDDGIVSTQNLNDINFSVFPNPTSDNLDIRINENDWKSGRVELLAITGNVLHSQKLNSFKSKINVERFEEGIYILVLTSDDGKTAKQMLCIMR